MKIGNILLISCLAALSFSPAYFDLHASQLPTDISQKGKPATIRILLAKKTPKALLEVKGRYHIYDPDNGLLIASGILSKRSYLAPHEDGLKWGEIFPSIHRVRIVPGDSQTTILVNGIEYKGCLEVYSSDGTLDLINEIDVDHYLKSTLNQQFPNKHSGEVMDAIAIVARTNAYYLIGRNPNGLWHVEAQEIGYMGHGIILQNISVDRAVENTSNTVLTYKERPFAATWTEDSAGKTADFSAIFRKNALSPKGVNVPLAARDREKHKWNFSMPKRQLAKIAQLDNITNIDLYLDKSSNKTYAIKVINEDESQSIDFLSLQEKLGTKNLASSDFTVSLKGDTVVFEGFGAGPGVGLCLYSAEIMAKHGMHVPQILASFFPNTQLENMRTPLKNVAHNR